MDYQKPILIKDLQLEYNKTKTQRNMFSLFKCHCGKEFKAQKNLVKCNRIKSCGCDFFKRKSESNKKHGKANTKIYKAWRHIKDRCLNKNDLNYSNYGGRGIKICDEWLNDFKSFYDWAMNNGYKDSLTIDRINNNGNYEPSNCRWATQATQTRNTRRIRKNNTSGYRGVTWNKRKRKWQVSITVNYKQVHLGYFDCRINGAYAYDNYIIENKMQHTKNF